MRGFPHEASRPELKSVAQASGSRCQDDALIGCVRFSLCSSQSASMTPFHAIQADMPERSAAMRSSMGGCDMNNRPRVPVVPPRMPNAAI